LLIKSGAIERAQQYAHAHGIPENAAGIMPQIYSTSVDQAVATAWVRLAMTRSDHQGAVQACQRWRQFAMHRGAVRAQLHWHLLLAQASFMSGDARAAQRSLRDAIVIATDGGLMRPFIDEGNVIRELLQEAYAAGPLTKHKTEVFAHDLLSRFGAGSTALASHLSPDEDDDTYFDGKINGREIEILNFVAAGLRNREIGDRLGLTEGSVKWYMQQIYDKIGARRRSVAVDRARQLGLLE